MIMQPPAETAPNHALPVGEPPVFSLRWGASQNRLLAFWLAYFVVWNAAWFGASLLGAFGNSISVWHPLAGLRFFVLLLYGWRALAPVLFTEGSLSLLL